MAESTTSLQQLDQPTSAPTNTIDHSPRPFSTEPCDPEALATAQQPPTTSFIAVLERTLEDLTCALRRPTTMTKTTLPTIVVKPRPSTMDLTPRSAAMTTCRKIRFSVKETLTDEEEDLKRALNAFSRASNNTSTIILNTSTAKPAHWFPPEVTELSTSIPFSTTAMPEVVLTPRHTRSHAGHPSPSSKQPSSS